MRSLKKRNRQDDNEMEKLAINASKTVCKRGIWAHRINPGGYLGVTELGSKGVKTIVFVYNGVRGS